MLFLKFPRIIIEESTAMSVNEESAIVVKAKPVRKVFKATKITKIPKSILENRELQNAIDLLPRNYNFEVHKTIWRVQELKAKTVALQMPEGLLMYATSIVDIIKDFTGAEVIIMGDVTYGACCIDDYSARALDVDLLIHYGHSCLIPVDQTSGIKILYIFVDIKIDPLHFIETITHNFSKTEKIALVSTIQFVTTLQGVAANLKESGYDISIPQVRPLSPGEILGCTAPFLRCADVVVYLGDGRFHLEAIMIANPKIQAYRYDPYEKKFTKEYYDHKEMEEDRKSAVAKSKSAGRFGVVMGTLGRQGSPKVVDHLLGKLEQRNKEHVVILLSEVFPDKLKLFEGVDAFVQIACPRLSIDWGSAFTKPTLTPYEMAVALDEAKWPSEEENYPMDFYANASLGHWTPNHKPELNKIDQCCGKCV